MKKSLPERTEAVYIFCRGFTLENGYPPTTREVAEGCGLGSNSTASRHLDKLVSLGYIRRGPNGRIAVVDFVEEVAQLQAACQMLEMACQMWKQRAEQASGEAHYLRRRAA